MPRELHPPVTVPAAELAEIKSLYLAGRYRAAFDRGSALGPPRAWSGPPARLLAGRLAMQLGAPRLGRQLHALTFRQSPAYPEAVYYMARYRLERFGPLGCWQFLRQHTDWSEAAPELRADWWALHAFVNARFRDFDRAEKYLADSEKLAPDRPWHHVERSSILEQQEKPEEALAAARRALEIQADFRPAVQAVGHLLTRQGKESEALEFLRDASTRIESGLVMAQVAALEVDLKHYAAAGQSLDRFAHLSPMMAKDVEEWLAARRADVAYHQGNFSEALAQAKKVPADDKFYPRFAANLEREQPTTSPRVLLEVDLTTDTAGGNASRNSVTPSDLLARFWGEALPPATPNDSPSTDGLPEPTERRRFAEAGWVCHEFTLTLPTAADLIARGLPFIVTLFETGYGQPRLVVGADPLRESLLLAEPGERRPVEAPLPLMMERFAATGPRCLVAVPKSQADKLTGLNLPDSLQHDRLFLLLSAVADFKLTEAKEQFGWLSVNHPEHRVTKLAAVAWARATQHPLLLTEAANVLLADHPHDATFGLLKINALRDRGRTEERTKFLRDEAEREDADPVMVQSYAQAVLTNPREELEVDRLLRLSVRARPHAPAGYFLLSAHRWERGEFAESVELHRIACCLDDREEQFAEAYVRVARATDQMSEALKLLQSRVRRSEHPAPATVRSLYHALVERGEPDFAWTALDKAIEKLAPGSVVSRETEASASKQAELRLFKAEQLANHGRFDDAEAELVAAKPSANPVTWGRTAAKIARTRPDYHAALEHLQAVLDRDPLNTDAQRLTAGLLQDAEGKDTARRFLNDLCGRFPDFYPALRLRAEVLTGEPDDSAEIATRRLLDLCPRDAWAWRQLALVLGDRRRIPEAIEAAEKSGEHEGDHPSYFAVLANVLRRADRTADAMATFRAGLERYIDHELAIAELVRTARGVKEKRAALQFVLVQLHAQETSGEGLLAYRDQALQLVTEPEDLETLHTELQEFLDERPDLWQSWSLMIQQLMQMQRAEEAYALAKEAAARFPLLARLWMDVADTARFTNRPEERIDAIRAALRCAPGWTPAARELAEALAEEDNFDDAILALEANLIRAPLDPLAHGFLAERLWNSDRGEEALAHAETAVRHEPGYDWAWQAVGNWGDRLEKPDAALDLARSLAKDRGGDARVLMKLARSLYRFDQTDEALAALDKAIALDPSSPEPYDLKAERLADVGRYDEAIAAANPSTLTDELPHTLQGRAAWVEARRGDYGRAIPMMQALVSVEPGYYWGWSQLAEWYNQTGKHEAYLEAAEEMIKLRPDHPTPLTYRGEAKLQTDDREGGKADLREALRIAPNYSPAAALLFDACLDDDELKDARAALSVLQEHMTGPEVLVKQIDFALHTDDHDAAADAFHELCMADGEGPPSSMQSALTDLRENGLEERAVGSMAEAWRSGEKFNPWAGLFWMDTPAGEQGTLSDRMAACDAVLREYPTFIPAHDRKAEQLTRAGRFDDARTACTAHGITPPPITLRGRAAWVEAARGDKDAAVKLMTACLADDPDYLWGWRQLAHWYDELGRHRDCLDAADHLVRLAPGDPYAYGIRGEAKRILGDHRGAKDDYEKAFELDPQFDAAGHQLLTEQLATDDLAGAGKTLDALREQDDDPRLHLRAVQLAARQKALPDARAALRAMAADESVRRPLLRDAAAAFDDENWTDEADDVLAAAVDGDDPTPAAAAIWGERLITAGKAWQVADKLKGLADRHPVAGREAVLVYAWAMAVTGQGKTAVATVQRFAELLRASDDAWGRAGATLAEAKEWGLTAAWLNDWKDRDGCEPWTLRALADSQRVSGDDDAAHATLLAAEELSDDDEEPLPPDMAAWLALNFALQGDADEASDRLDTIPTTGQDDPVRLLLVLTNAVLGMKTATNKGKALREAKANIRAAADACTAAEVPPGLGRVYQKVVDAITKDAGLLAKAWAMWQKMKPLVV